MIFHSVSKSMLFEGVGATENSIGSRDIEHMHGLILRPAKLAYIMGIGIAGMYLAPFGMLITQMGRSEVIRRFRQCRPRHLHRLRQRDDDVLLDQMAGQLSPCISRAIQKKT